VPRRTWLTNDGFPPIGVADEGGMAAPALVPSASGFRFRLDGLDEPYDVLDARRVDLVTVVEPLEDRSPHRHVSLEPWAGVGSRTRPGATYAMSGGRRQIMATAINERIREAAVTVREATVAACRQAATMSREALGEDTVENLRYVADNAAQKARQGLQVVDDCRSETAHRIRRQPFVAVGLTLAFGLAIGVVIGRMGFKRQLITAFRDE